MTVQREKVTIITLINGKEVERKKSKILVHRCSDCGKIIYNYDQKTAVCGICGTDMCEDHRVNIPYLGDGCNRRTGGNICITCNKEYEPDLKLLKQAAEAYRAAHMTHASCGKVSNELVNTLFSKMREEKKCCGEWVPVGEPANLKDYPNPDEFFTYGE